MTAAQIEDAMIAEMHERLAEMEREDDAEVDAEDDVEDDVEDNESDEPNSQRHPDLNFPQPTQDDSQSQPTKPSRDV